MKIIKDVVVSNNFYNFKNMKSFDLNSYGVQEMSVQEMKEVGGGEGTFFRLGYSREDGVYCYLFGFKIL